MKVSVLLTIAFLFTCLSGVFAQLENISQVELTFTSSQGNVITASAINTGAGLQSTNPINLQESTRYDLSIVIESSGADITPLVQNSANNYQFFYTSFGGVLNGAVVTTDTDNQGLPLGVTNALTTACTQTGDLTGNLRIVLADLTDSKTATSAIGDGSSFFDVDFEVNITDNSGAPPCGSSNVAITNAVLTWTPATGGGSIITSAEDPDGTGPLGWVTDGPIALAPNTEYFLSIDLSNPTENVNFTLDIQNNADEYLFFFAWTEGIFDDPPGNGNFDFRADPINYDDSDQNNLPVGLLTQWTTTVESDMNGDFRVVLKHQAGSKSTTSTVAEGGTDFDVIWTIDRITDVNEPMKGEATALRVFPNPTRQQITWQLKATDQAIESVSLLDQWGRVVRQGNAGEPLLSLVALPVGLYYLQVQSETTVWTQRVVKL